MNDLSHTAREEGTAAPRASVEQAVLTVALEADRPTAPPVRLALDGLDEVVLGRGGAVAAVPLDGDPRRLHLRLPDRFLSSTHARLVPRLGLWRFEDAGSRNGSSVNGQPAAAQLLGDGDVLELARTFLVFRQRAPLDGEAGLRGPEDAGGEGLVTIVPGLARAYRELAAVAPASVSVILHGEVGCGKEVIARAVHRLSGRRGPFVAVNCGALPASLVESELFGYRKGAFSGALEDRPGLIRSADGGTLFLDEIAELPPAAQVALLRVLQEREVTPLGAARPIPVDVRVVSASHRDLPARVAAGALRQDLLSRLAGYTLSLSPLRARREDLGLLIAALLPRLTSTPEAVRFHPRAARILFQHPFPDNVRELATSLGRAIVLAAGGPVGPEHLPPEMQAPAPPKQPPPAAVTPPADERTPAELSPADAARRAELVTLLTREQGNVTAVARLLGKAPLQIRRWIQRYAIPIDSYRK